MAEVVLVTEEEVMGEVEEETAEAEVMGEVEETVEVEVMGEGEDTEDDTLNSCSYMTLNDPGPMFGWCQANS